MERISLCDVTNCGKPATVICLKGNQKMRCCAGHGVSNLDKGYVVMKIEADSLVSNVSDEPFYRERKTLTERGIGNLTALEAACESELQAALKLLEAEKGKVLKTVEERFNEMKLALAKKSEETKLLLAELHNNYNEFLTSKSAVLSPLAEQVCKDVKVQPRFFRFAVVDVTDEIARVLFDAWTISTWGTEDPLQCLDPSQKGAMVTKLWKEAASQAKKGLLEALQYADSMVEDQSLFPQEREAVQAEILKREKARMQANIEWLNSAWDIRQQSRSTDRETMSIGLKLANLYSVYLGEYSKAEAVLKYCYEQNSQALSEDSMPLWNAIISLYFSHAQFEEMQNMGLSILQIPLVFALLYRCK